jgi:hypothetical protein
MTTYEAKIAKLEALLAKATTKGAKEFIRKELADVQAQGN